MDWKIELSDKMLIWKFQASWLRRNYSQLQLSLFSLQFENKYKKTNRKAICAVKWRDIHSTWESKQEEEKKMVRDQMEINVRRRTETSFGEDSSAFSSSMFYNKLVIVSSR